MSTHNSNIPNDYEKPIDAPKFQAPAHHLDERQREAVVELAESSHRDTGSSSTQTSHSTGGLTGSTTGLTGNSSAGLTGSSSHSHEHSSHSHSGTHGTGAAAGLTGAGAAATSGRDHHSDDRSNVTRTDSIPHQKEVNSAPGVGDAAPKPGQANSGGTNHGSFPNVTKPGDQNAGESSNDKVGNEPGSEYPPQLHAGKVGLGPNYHATGHESLTDKIKNVVPGLHGTKEADHHEDRQQPMGAAKRLGEDTTDIGK